MRYSFYGLVILGILNLALLFLLFRMRRRQSPANSNLSYPGRESLPEQEVSLPIEPLEHADQELLQNILEFRDSIVREVMVPRIDIVAVEEATPLTTFLNIAVAKGHSRIPVFRGTIDQIIGVAYIKDMLRYCKEDTSGLTVAAFMRPPYFVPETKNIGTLLQEFQSQKVHIAVAIDEYGGTAGIVTIEDLFEVVFGDIIDEHDAEKDLITVLDDHTIEVNAKTGIDELEKYMGTLELTSQDFETVGGLLFSILGQVPQSGDTVTYQHLKFTILRADKHRIVTVKVEKLPFSEESPAAT